MGSLAPGLILVIPVAVPLVDAFARAAWTTLGRDQGIFQYVAWAVASGDKLYRDVRDVNGPLVAVVHLFFQALGGSDEHRFRMLDLGLSSGVFVVVGASLPSLGRGPTLLARLGWGIAAWAALGAQYIAYGWWDTAQRESFFDAFVLVSVAAQLGAQTSWRARLRRARATNVLLVVAGAASALPWLGKPTYALITIVQLVSLTIDDVDVSRRRRLLPFAFGGVLGVAGLGVFLMFAGDPAAYARIVTVDVPAMYRFIWPRPVAVIFLMPGYLSLAVQAAVTTAVALALMIARALPRRALPIALMPIFGLASVAAQAKGFPYHFHPVTLGTSLVWIAVLAWATNDRRGIAVHIVAMGFSALVGVRAARLAQVSPDPPLTSLGDEERIHEFDRYDFAPNGLRLAAAYVAANTGPNDRVQMYGMDPYVLFLAKRRSATPYIYAYDLNVDAALHGSWEEGGPRPTEAQRAIIRGMRDAHERDLLARLERAPPAAFVFVDNSPLMTSTDAVRDFEAHCPNAARWMRGHYASAAEFEGVHVWLLEKAVRP